ncbi:hypothetical protein [Streptomyces sp. NPDC001594]|uniref:hypothetical protein n=1 Tax=Streptomyces sp. NPDC001594 TaxID=3364590 RepID=UPI00367BFFEB
MSRLQPAAERLCRGAAVLLTGYTAGAAGWVRAAHSLGGRALRVALLAVPPLLAWRLVQLLPVVLWVVAAWGCWAAWRAGPQPIPPAPAVNPVSANPAEAVRALLRELIGDAPGVHLKTVLMRLQEDGHHTSWKVADLRRHIEALGIPVEPKLKLNGTPTRGVRREAVSPTPRPAAEGVPPVASPVV